MRNGWLARRGIPVGLLRTELDRVFEDVFGDYQRGRGFTRAALSGESFPAVNLWEDDQKLYAEAEVPGMGMEELEIFVKGNELTVRGERSSVDLEGATYHRRERGAGPFCSVVQLPMDIEAERVEASLENGVLTVTLPKAAVARPRKIVVKPASK